MSKKPSPTLDMATLTALTSTLKDLYDHVPEALLAVDPFGDVCYVNEPTFPFLGRTAPHFYGQPFEEVLAGVLDSFGQRQVFPRLKSLMLDGSSFKVSCHLHPFPDRPPLAVRVEGTGLHGLFFIRFIAEGEGEGAREGTFWSP